MKSDNFDVYKYYKGESRCPDTFVSPLKSSFWNCESWWHLNQHNERNSTLEQYVKKYCNAIADKWAGGSGYSGEDVYTDYLQPSTDSLKD